MSHICSCLRIGAVVVIASSYLLIDSGTRAHAQSVVPAHLNGWIVRSNELSNFSHQDFQYALEPFIVGGDFTAFTVDDPNLNGGGVGYNAINNLNAPNDQVTGQPVDVVDFSITDTNGVTAYDILDRGSFGGNFDRNEYAIEVLFKVGPNNTAPSFNVMLEQWDGFETNTASAEFGMRKGEQLQWGSFQSGVVPEGGIADYYNDPLNPHDDDGFAILRIPMSVAPQFTGDSFLFGGGNNALSAAGDGSADLDAFQNHTPNGFGQIHIQAPFNSDAQRLDVEVRDIRIVPVLRNPTVVARFDALSGIGRRFGTPFTEDNGGGEFLLFDHDNNAGTPSIAVLETDQVQRFDENGFTNLIIQTDDDLNVGGVGMWQDHLYQTFDGTTATLNVTAKLTAHNTATFVDMVLNDLDGADDSAAGAGGEEYKYYLDLSQFNTSTFTTVSIPLSDFDERIQAFETFNDGDASLADFNMYYLGLVTRELGGLVGLEIESVQVTAAAASSGDFDQDGDVDGRDFLIWQRNVGTNNGARAVLDAGDGDYDGDVDSDDLAIWQAQYGGGALAAANTAVPEPASWLLIVGSATAVFLRRATARS
jgi:hypothetical protein